MSAITDNKRIPLLPEITLEEISPTDLVVIEDVSGGSSVTKKGQMSTLQNYILSNGHITASVTNAINALTASYILPSSIGTVPSASTAHSAAFCTNATYAITSSYALTVDASGIIGTLPSVSVSQTASYVNFNGTDNGMVFTSISSSVTDYAKSSSYSIYTGIDNGTVTTSLTSSHIVTPTNAYIQNGNSFGTTGVIGTNDNNNVLIKTNGTTKVYISASGQVALGAMTQPTYSFTVTLGGNTGPSSPTFDLGSVSSSWKETYTRRLLSNSDLYLDTHVSTSIVSIGTMPNTLFIASGSGAKNVHIAYGNLSSSNLSILSGSENGQLIIGSPGQNTNTVIYSFISTSGSIQPMTDGVYDLGGNARNWNKLYVNQVRAASVIGDLTGTADRATVATSASYATTASHISDNYKIFGPYQATFQNTVAAYLIQSMSFVTNNAVAKPTIIYAYGDIEVPVSTTELDGMLEINLTSTVDGSVLNLVGSNPSLKLNTIASGGLSGYMRQPFVLEGNASLSGSYRLSVDSNNGILIGDRAVKFHIYSKADDITLI